MTTATMDDLAGKLERAGDHFNRVQWTWFTTDEVDGSWEARVGFLEDPVGSRWTGLESQQAAIDTAQERAAHMLSQRQAKLKAIFEQRVLAVIPDTGVTCRPEEGLTGWNISFGALYGRRLVGENRTLEQQYDDFEDACMLCCLAEQQHRKTKLPNYYPEMEIHDLHDLNKKKFMSDLFGEAMAHVLTDSQRASIVAEYNRRLNENCAGL